MKGTRPLDNDEIRSVSTCFTGTFGVRSSGLFILGVSTGGRISELLSLLIGDVWQNGTAVTDCTATGKSGHSLKQDCGIIPIYLKGVSGGETEKIHP